MIRLAFPADKNRVIQLLKDSRLGAGFDSLKGPTGFSFPFESAYAERLFVHHATSLDCLCLIYSVNGRAEGVLMAAVSEHPFGPVKLARETVWWIDPQHRGSAAVRMLDAYEAWASGRGCDFFGMAGMGDDPVVAKLYLRRGYKIAETHYLKAVD